MMRSGIVAAAVMLALAGCADEGALPPEETHNDFQLEATETTGVIRGVVVDTAIVPIAGATVHLDALDGPMQESNVNGEFAFSKVEPGIHYLFVDAVGFGEVKQQTHAVEAGVVKPPVVMVQLTPDKSELPLVVPLLFNGYIDCSISTPAYRVAACGVVGIPGVSQDDFLRTHQDVARDPWHMQAEMVWRSTQAAGTAMTFTMEHSASDGGQIGPGAAGESPIVIRADKEMLDNGPFAGHIMHRVFNFEHPATTPPVPVCGVPNPVHGGTMCVKGWGATVQQDFEIFTHVFYRFAPPEGWQFSVDGPAVVPES